MIWKWFVVAAWWIFFFATICFVFLGIVHFIKKWHMLAKDHGFFEAWFIDGLKAMVDPTNIKFVLAAGLCILIAFLLMNLVQKI